MRRVRSFDLEHLSLFSTMSDEEIDSIIQDFIARHGSTTGETYLRMPQRIWPRDKVHSSGY